jgi:CRISPR system Cascade subunit CasD
MTDFLLLTVHAPLASWGDINVGTHRGSWDRPSRSAILGMIAAAQGVDREDDAAQLRLSDALGIAVRMDARGFDAMDYHTVQTVGQSVAKKVVQPTRRRLVEADPGQPDKIVSTRGFLMDSLSTVAVWLEGEAEFALEDLARQLRRPEFVPYAGRKAHALALPLAPEVIRASTLADAFLAREAGRGIAPAVPEGVRKAMEMFWNTLRPRAGWGREVMYDVGASVPTGLHESGMQALVRRDRVGSRQRWHFQERRVAVGILPEATTENWEARF